MKIYTRTGDAGETGLLAGARVSKGHVRLHAYGTIDELNTVLGVALAAGLDEGLHTPVRRIQSELFIVGADLSAPLEVETDRVLRVSPAMVKQLEDEIDEWEAQLPPLKNFILPGGGLAAAYLHQARTVCRRAERWVVTLKETEPVNAQALRYINRLSDWLFVAARLANRLAAPPDPVWQQPAVETPPSDPQ